MASVAPEHRVKINACFNAVKQAVSSFTPEDCKHAGGLASVHEVEEFDPNMRKIARSATWSRYEKLWAVYEEIWI